ncbi:MAG: SDR family oxidoreductase [Oscillospiraceae bacterium]|nr:SDR family oxidoreductase [Oscillospiraceae bacterium]
MDNSTVRPATDVRKALVTGAGSGLGRGIARALALAGYDVAMHTGSNEERARALADELRESSGRRVEALTADFSKPGGADELFRQYPFDTLDLYVNNAGVTMGATILNMTEEIFDTVSNINWKNAYFCVQRAARLMVDNGTRGNIIIISSNNHAVNWNGISIYAVLKEALVKFTRHAAMEFAQYGIRVNCIAPGWINTGEARLERHKVTSLKGIPLKRWVEPSEIGEWILFLASPAAASLTGDVIELDGGVRIMSGKPESYGL